MEPLRRAIALILIEDLDPFGPAIGLLKRVDAGDYHMLPLDDLGDHEAAQADRLISRGLLRHVRADRRFPDRLVVTGAGSHALGTFASDTLHDEKRAAALAKRGSKLGSPVTPLATVEASDPQKPVGKPSELWRDTFLSDEALDDEGEQRATRSITRGPEWLEAERARLEAMPFEHLLRVVRWNDPNGAWSDRELQEYGTDKEMLVDVIMDWIADGLETPEEWIAGSRRPF